MSERMMGQNTSEPRSDEGGAPPGDSFPEPGAAGTPASKPSENSTNSIQEVDSSRWWLVGSITQLEPAASAGQINASLPHDAAELTRLSNRNEYTDDRIRKAAEIVWLGERSLEAIDWNPEPDAEWLTFEENALRDRLLLGEPERGTVNHDLETLRWRALVIVNLPRIVASSSRWGRE